LQKRAKHTKKFLLFCSNDYIAEDFVYYIMMLKIEKQNG